MSNREMQAFLMRKLKMSGSMGLAMKLQPILVSGGRVCGWVGCCACAHAWWAGMLLKLVQIAVLQGLPQLCSCAAQAAMP